MRFVLPLIFIAFVAGLSGCTNYVPIVTDLEILPIRAIEWRDFEAGKIRNASYPTTAPVENQ